MDHGSYFLLSLTFLTATLSVSEAAVSVTTDVGQMCELPCSGLRGLRVSVLEWSFPERKRDLLLLRGGTVLDGYEHPDYTNRVQLLDPLLKDGELSVFLKKVTLEDSGTYRCEALYEDERVTSESIHLTVVAGARVSVTVPEGQDCELPCSGLKGQKARSLKWFYSDQRTALHGFREESEPPTSPPPEDTKSNELMDPELQSTDLGWILKKVTVQDSGTYGCAAVYEDGEEKQVIYHFVHLTVTEPGPEATEPETGTILGLSSGGVFGLGLVGVAVYFGLRKFKRSKFLLNVVSHFKPSKKPTSSLSTHLPQPSVSTSPRSDAEYLRVRVL